MLCTGTGCEIMFQDRPLIQRMYFIYCILRKSNKNIHLKNAIIVSASTVNSFLLVLCACNSIFCILLTVDTKTKFKVNAFN